MRWMKWSSVALCSTVALACKSEATKRAEVKTCSAIAIDAKGAAQCLVAQYRWNLHTATLAATAYKRETDSLARIAADSAWRIEGPRHQQEVVSCATDPSGEVARCLEGYGWADARAIAAADSQWRADAPKHRDELARCAHVRDMQAGACLQLHYKWSPEHALAVDDSIRRARMRR